MNLYCITFPNGKRYFGIETKIGSRWKRHQQLARISPRLPVHKAIRKYGAIACRFNYIYQNISKEYAIDLEIAFIKAFKTLERNFGYNRTEGGGGIRGHHYKVSDSEKKLRSERLKKIHAERKGSYWTKEGREKINKSLRDYLVDKYAKMSAEEKKAVARFGLAGIKKRWDSGAIITPEQRSKMVEGIRSRTTEQKAITSSKMSASRKKIMEARKLAGLPILECTKPSSKIKIHRDFPYQRIKLQPPFSEDHKKKLSEKRKIWWKNRRKLGLPLNLHKKKGVKPCQTAIL